MDILRWPFVYNLRFLVAGDQKKTSDFIKLNYKKLKCHEVLDLGCGTGDFCKLFKHSEYLGVDVNSKYVKFCKEKYPKYNFICEDITKFPINKKFDCTIFISTLHHLSDTAAKKVLSAAFKQTKKIVIVVDLNPDTDPVRKFLIDHDRGNYVRTTEQKIKLLEDFGEVIKLEHFNTGLASQSGIVLKPKSRKK